MSFEKQLINYRREFHMYPELGWREIRTTARIAEILYEMGYEELIIGDECVEKNSILHLVKMTKEESEKNMSRAIEEGADPKWVEKTKGYSGIIAEYDTGIDGPVVAFRFDIDALPDTEHKDSKAFKEGYISKHEGVMHSCGHDGHIAMGLGLAKLLKEKKHNQKLKGKVRLIFQPAEETYSGAESIRDKGWLDDVDYFIALHLALSHDGGPMVSKTLSGGSNDFLSDTQLNANFIGRAAHPCGASQEGNNAILAACTAALNLHTIAPHEEGLSRINVGEIKGGSAPNIIAPEASLVLEYRGETKNITEYAEKRVYEILKSAARMHNCELELLNYGDIPTGKSDDELVDIIIDSGKEIPWFEEIYRYSNVGGTDDATVMMNRVQEKGGKATYFGIGADIPVPVHNSGFDFDERVLEPTARLLYKICENIAKI